MVVLLAGLALCVTGTGGAGDTAPDPALGNLFALASGVTWAATLLGLRWLAKSGATNGAGAAVIVGNLLAFACAVPFALPPSGDGTDWALILYLGIVQIAIAYLLLTAAVRVVAAFEVSLLLLVEPALNPVWSWLFLGEKPGAVTIAGGVLILGATAVKVWADAPPRDGDRGGGGRAGRSAVTREGRDANVPPCAASSSRPWRARPWPCPPRGRPPPRRRPFRRSGRWSVR